MHETDFGGAWVRECSGDRRRSLPGPEKKTCRQSEVWSQGKISSVHSHTAHAQPISHAGTLFSQRFPPLPSA